MRHTLYALSLVAPEGQGSTGVVVLVVQFAALIAIFYFLLIRPQQKKQKEARAMLEALEKGNEVVTAGGVLGRIVKIDEQYVTVEVAPNTQMVVQRAAISQLLPKGTLKGL